MYEHVGWGEGGGGGGRDIIFAPFCDIDSYIHRTSQSDMDSSVSYGYMKRYMRVAYCIESDAIIVQVGRMANKNSDSPAFIIESFLKSYLSVNKNHVPHSIAYKYPTAPSEKWIVFRSNLRNRSRTHHGTLFTGKFAATFAVLMFEHEPFFCWGRWSLYKRSTV